MSFNKDNYNRIREEYSSKYLRAEDAATQRKIELWGKIDGLRGIDLRLSKTGPRLMAIALHQSEETVDSVRADVEQLNRDRAALLERAGYRADVTDPVYECPICRDQGYVGWKMCDCMRNRLIEEGYRSAGIANLLRTQSFETFDLNYYAASEKTYQSMKFNFESLKSYAENFDPASSQSIALYGGTGLGKTHLSTAVAKVVIERGFDVVYSGVIGMIADFERDRFGNSSGNQSGNATARYYDCDLLIIDDLGAEVANQFTVSCIYDVLNHRMNMNRPTMINMNMTPADLQKRYWDRISSRIMGNCRPFVFSGTDVRKQKLR